MGNLRIPLPVLGLWVIGWALPHHHHWVGLVLALAVTGLGYLFSVRRNPRVICSRCDGEGRYRGWIFRWAWHWCHRCGGNGRQIRWGSARWGTPAAQAEAAKNRTAAAGRPRRR
jgi:hypothetical protein